MFFGFLLCTLSCGAVGGSDLNDLFIGFSLTENQNIRIKGKILQWAEQTFVCVILRYSSGTPWVCECVITLTLCCRGWRLWGRSLCLLCETSSTSGLWQRLHAVCCVCVSLSCQHRKMSGWSHTSAAKTGRSPDGGSEGTHIWQTPLKHRLQPQKKRSINDQ